MDRSRFSAVVWLTLVLTALGSSQVLDNFNVAWVPDGSIAIDGSAAEWVWQPGVLERHSMNAPTYLGSGVIDGDADKRAEWSVCWDNTAFYLCVWTYDDFPYAPHSMFLSDANNGYDDDGLEFFVNISYADMATGIPNERHGELGMQLIKGFGNSNPAEQYGGMWDTRNNNWYTEYWTVDQEHSNGWYNTFATLNGQDYVNELKLTWDGIIMNNNGKPNQGHELGFHFYVDDNDGAMTAEGVLQLVKPIQVGAIQVAKFIMGPRPNIHSRSVSLSRVPQAQASSAMYDIMGRKIAANALLRNAAVRFSADSRMGTAKSLVIR